VAAFSIAVVAGFVAVLLSWNGRWPPGVYASGLFQGDMPTYVCWGREAARSPDTLFYANAFDIRDDPPRVYLNLPISLIGWNLRAGVPPAAIAFEIRIVFGVLFYALLGALLNVYFRERIWFWAAFAIVGLGGGIAWIHAASGVSDLADLDRWSRAIRAIERPYYWWFLNGFRNLQYPLELIYHALLVGQLFCLATRRLTGATVLYALAVASNPFVAAQMTGVAFGALLLQQPRPWRHLAASAAIAAAFAAFYGWWVARDPVLATFHAAHVDVYPEPLAWRSMWTGYGWALVGLPAWLLDAGFRRSLRDRWNVVPVVVLVVWTLLLVHNSRLPFERSLQPMHFTRGYLHLGLWVLTLLWLRSLAERLHVSRPAVIATLAALALLALPDNLSFLRDQWRIPPHRPSLVWGEAEEAVHRYLRAQPEPLRVLAPDSAMGRLVCALHEHRSAFGTETVTPEFRKRVLSLRASRREGTPSPLVDWAEVILVPARGLDWAPKVAGDPHWREEFCNATWCVFRRVRDAG